MIVSLAFLLVVSLLYAIPNLFGDDPAVQISTTDRIEVPPQVLLYQVSEIAKKHAMPNPVIDQEGQAVLVRFNSTDTQIKARDVFKAELGNDYVAALNLAPRTPSWLQAIGANPMKLGLDLRGGVHFLLGVDVDAMVQSRQKGDIDEIKKAMRDEKIRYKHVSASKPQGIDITLKSGDVALKRLLANRFPDYHVASADNHTFQLRLPLSVQQKLVNYAIDQTMTIFTNRVNELGVSEAVVQRQGRDKITVDLPGIQDMTRAKELIGKTASLRFQMADDEHDATAAKRTGIVPLGTQLFEENGMPTLLKRQVILRGDSITYAMATPDSNGMPSVSIRLGGGNERLFYKTTAENIHKRLAVIYSEPVMETAVVDGKPKQVRRVHERIISLATIQSALGNSFNITGLSSKAYAQNLALLLRSGALVAPVDFLEERLVGPSLGQANIDKGIKSLAVGSLLVILFMLFYYRFFGLVANLALMFNVVLIVSGLSLIGATLTLAGIAGIVLTIGMAVDANVLINERIREELANGMSPQASIHAGYEKAFSTIVDANATTLIVAVVLFALGSPSVKGFAITLTIGLLASMLTAIFFTRAIVNAWYGHQSRPVLSIGSVANYDGASVGEG